MIRADDAEKESTFIFGRFVVKGDLSFVAELFSLLSKLYCFFPPNRSAAAMVALLRFLILITQSLPSPPRGGASALVSCREESFSRLLSYLWYIRRETELDLY